jgi:hypothetical protein
VAVVCAGREVSSTGSCLSRMVVMDDAADVCGAELFLMKDWCQKVEEILEKAAGRCQSSSRKPGPTAGVHVTAGSGGNLVEPRKDE